MNYGYIAFALMGMIGGFIVAMYIFKVIAAYVIHHTVETLAELMTQEDEEEKQE